MSDFSANPSSGAEPTAIGLSDQQRRAVETRHVSVALSAGAGCGKTFVLTERFQIGRAHV